MVVNDVSFVKPQWKSLQSSICDQLGVWCVGKAQRSEFLHLVSAVKFSVSVHVLPTGYLETRSQWKALWGQAKMIIHKDLTCVHKKKKKRRGPNTYKANKSKCWLDAVVTLYQRPLPEVQIEPKNGGESVADCSLYGPQPKAVCASMMILWPWWGVGSPTFLVLPQQIKTQNGGYLSQGWELIGGKKHWRLQESTSSSNILQTHGNSQVEYSLPFWCGRMSRPHHTHSLEWGLPFTLYWVRWINEEVGTCWTTMPRPDWLCLSVV